MALKADPTTPQIAKKAAVIAEIKGKLDGSDATVLTEYRGMTVPQIAQLRAALRPAGAEYKIYKNTLVQRAADEAGVGEQLSALLTGPVAVAFVNGDAAAAAKALRDFAKANPSLILKGGLLGPRTLTASDVEALADLPSREALLSQIAGLFEAPMAQTAGVLSALLRDTVGLVAALIDKLPAAVAPVSTDAAPVIDDATPIADAPAEAVADEDAPAEVDAAPADEDAPVEAVADEDASAEAVAEVDAAPADDASASE